MNLPKKTILSTLLLAALPFLLSAREEAPQTTREEYVEMYKGIAIAHMERYGIPASITLAQGILESSCGNSYLARMSNNHFGIKCKRDWKGDTISYDDDAKGECFRKYDTVEESYLDHAEFLDKQPRYDSLFVYSSTDYKSWARGLKAAGYATAPDYADRLIRIIEESKLYLLDREDGNKLYAEAHGATSEQIETAIAADGIDPDSYRVTINAHRGYNVYRTNGVCYVTAKEGDQYEHIASLFMVSARNLRRFNDVAKDAQPKEGDIIFIERKRKAWDGNALLHTVRRGETLHSLSQSYGIRLKSLARLNKLPVDCKLNDGQSIKIR